MDCSDLPLFRVPWPERGATERQFWAFHLKNPQVYRTIVRIGNSLLEHQNKLSIKHIFEVARYTLFIESKSKFKLNNNYTAFYARLLWEQEPGFEKAFKFRQQKRKATIGPVGEPKPTQETYSGDA